MPRIRFGATWSIPMNRIVRPGPGMLAVRIDPEYLIEARSAFTRLNERQSTLPDLMPLDITVEWGATKRSLDSNRLMWALYDFQARVANAGQIGTEMVTKEDLYRSDMTEFADVYQIDCWERDLPSLRALGWAWRQCVPLEGRDGWMRVDMIVTSSKWDSARMHRHLQMMFNRLAEDPPHDRGGAEQELMREWAAWRQELNDRRIALDPDASMDRYRAVNPICEGCGRFIGHEGGEIHHISSRGSRARTPVERESPMNWLHLCHGCHSIVTAVNGGVARFLERFPHNRNKVEEALRRAVPAAVGDDGIPSGTPDNEGGF